MTFVKTDFDSEHGVMVYEVEFYAGSVEYEYDINAQTGEVVKYSRESKTTSVPSTTVSGDYIGEAAAKSAALSNAGVSESEVTRIKCELDRDHGSYKYEIEFSVGRMEYEYEIDAYTGAILKAEHDYDD